MVKNSVISLCLLLVSSCSHSQSTELLAERQSQGRPRAAAYAADGFYNDPHYKESHHRIPPDDFFFKKCRINQWAPYPAMHQWECTEAMK
jgi:hypothetical protein